MFYPFYDWTMFILIPGIIIAIWAQSRVTSTYRAYSKIPVSRGISGSEAARRILQLHGLYDIDINATNGMLTDNYNPRKRTLNLSEENFGSSSIAAVAVAAHEAGHALQHSEGYIPLSIRSLMAPVVSVASYMLWPIFFLGILGGFATFDVINIVVYIFIGILAFQLVTLPVEYNASRRALSALTGSGMLNEEEIYGAKKVLNAAALTYVAATLMALLNVLRFMAYSRRR